MVINFNIIKLLNFRIEQEEQSSRIYSAMSNWLNLNGFLGASKLWKKYSEEELVHAGWTYQFMLDLNILPPTPELKTPQVDGFKGLPQIIALSLAHEMKITKQCNELAKACLSEGDFLSFELAQRYCKEQIDEIAKLQTFVDKLNAFGESNEVLRLLDNEMGGL